MQAVVPAPHEFTINLVFDEHGLQPFFAADAQVKAGGGSQKAAFEHFGEQWTATLYHQDSGFIPPETGQTPAGTEIDLEEIREYRIHVQAVDDPLERKRVNFHIAPRWQDMRAKKADGSIVDFSVPSDIEEGVNVRAGGANIPFHQYHELLRQSAKAVGINRWYFDNPHEHSNVVDAARYLRLLCDRSGPLHARDGTIAKMGHLLEHDRTGYRSLVQNDSDDNDRNLPGYYHTATLGPERVKQAFPDHTIPREVKHYYAREALNYDEDHPLRHPKLEVAYQSSRWSGKVGLDELDDLVEQLDQTLHSVLAEDGIQIQYGPDGPFREDAYWEPSNEEFPDDWLYNMDLTQIEQNQESIVLKYLEDGLSPVTREAIQYLATDGGEVSPKDIAQEHDRHVDSVRRALRERADLFHREYNRVAFRSRHVANLLHKKLELAREIFEDISAAGAKASYAADRELDETTSAFIAWAELVGIDVDSSKDAQLKMRLPTYQSHKQKLHDIREGFRLWIDAGRDPIRYRQALIHFSDGSRASAWQYL